MGSIALLARELGHEISGSDENVYPPMSTQLEQAGIKLDSGYTRNSVPEDTELVVVGNANLPRGNPALEAVLNSQIPYTSGAEWLSRYLLHDRWVIAVAGTHGKTTTASMVSWILDYAGLNPGFLIGGMPNNFHHSSRLGAPPFFVIEADEYDTSYFDRRSKFLHYRPKTLVLNNLEYDHADIFEDLDAIKNQFHLLLRSVPSHGLIVHPDSDENLQDVINQGCWSETLIIGGAGFYATSHSEDGASFTVTIDQENCGTVNWSLTGAHNVSNALAAIAAARHAGVPANIAIEALNRFSGVKRRMEVIHTDDLITIYDDFAHHPTEISTTLAGLRAKVGTENILAIIEPASHTMRKGTHETSLGNSATCADTIFWLRPANANWDMSILNAEQSSVIDSVDEILSRAADTCKKSREPLHVVIMSNGSFQGLHQKLIDELSG